MATVRDLQEYLQHQLGDGFSSYLSLMQDWFGQRITKDFFDAEISQLLERDALCVHNEIMKQLLHLGTGIPPPVPKGVLTLSSNERAPAYTVTFSNSSEAGQEGEDMSNGILMSIEEQDSSLHSRAEEPQVVKPFPVMDWLYDAEILTVDASEAPIPSCPFLPPVSYTQMVSDCHFKRPYDLARVPDILCSVTHAYDVSDRLSKVPLGRLHLKQVTRGDGTFVVPHGSSVYGRFLLKAWGHGLEGGVDSSSTQLVVAAVKEHIRMLIKEIVKQRRAFRMRNDKVCHSIGAPYPNPYLRLGNQLFDDMYSSDSTKMADIMQIPKLLPTNDELERAAIQGMASAAPPKSCRFPANRGTLADLLTVIENNPGIIPHSSLRFKLILAISEKCQTYEGNFSTDWEDDDDILPEDMPTEAPLCLY